MALFNGDLNVSLRSSLDISEKWQCKHSL